jgi:putative transposase
MARMARAVNPGIPHHITQRASRRQKVFFFDEDYQLNIQLISRLETVPAVYSTAVYAL